MNLDSIGQDSRVTIRRPGAPDPDGRASSRRRHSISSSGTGYRWRFTPEALRDRRRRRLEMFPDRATCGARTLSPDPPTHGVAPQPARVIIPTLYQNASAKLRHCPPWRDLSPFGAAFDDRCA